MTIIPKRRGYARREFIAVKESFRKLMIEGHTYASAHDELVEKHGITMPYRTFIEYARKDHPTGKPRKLKTPSREFTKKRKVNDFAVDQIGVDTNNLDELLAPHK